MTVLVALMALFPGYASAATSSSTTNPGANAAAPPTTAAKAPANVVTFGTQTASATQPDGRGYFDFGSGAGGQIADHVAVRNYSNQTITVTLKGTDAVNTPQGGLAALPVNETSKDVGAWIQLPASDLTLTIAPRHDVIVPFRVVVPKDALPGDHVGAITATLQSSVISKSGQRVKLLQTAGTRMFLRVSGPLHPNLSVEGIAVRYEGTWNPAGKGRAVITWSVRNSGNVGLGGRQTVYVSGLFGSRKSAVRVADVQLLLPGFSVKESVTVTGILPEVRDTAHVSLSPLYIPGSVQPASGPFKATVTFWALPWPDMIIVAIALLALGALLYRRRRRRGSPPGAGSDPPKRPGRSAGPSEPSGGPAKEDLLVSVPAGDRPTGTVAADLAGGDRGVEPAVNSAENGVKQ
ncbi:MAG: DUF916 domain-containing protein [Acidobacteriota bacterium]|nr:DUF916 domain-containing protein [Acidobacteriota bacterium]